MSELTFDQISKKVCDSYFEDKYTLSKVQIESYNDLITNIIPSIIENNNPIIISDTTSYDTGKRAYLKYYKINILNPRFDKPCYQTGTDTNKQLMFPFEARTRGLSYMSQLIVDVQHQFVYGDETTEVHEIPDVKFCKIPCMLHSKICNLNNLDDASLKKYKECIFDIGGYFIVNGGEKVIVSQERVAENKVFVWPPIKNTSSKYSHECEIKSSIDQRFNPIEGFRVMLSKSEKQTLYCRVIGFKNDIPLFVLMRALGITTDKEIFTIILGSNHNNENMYKLVKKSCKYLIDIKDKNTDKGDKHPDDKDKRDKEANVFVYTQDDALLYLCSQLKISLGSDENSDITNKKMKIVYDILNRKLLPHCGLSFKKKAVFIGYMTNRLLLSYFNIRPYDDRDHYSNKRLNTAGVLLSQIFRTYYINHIKEMKKTIALKLQGVPKTFIYTNLSKLVVSSSIESRLKYVLSTGNWGTNKNKDSSSDKGVAQVLNRLGFYTYLSHIRRVCSPLEHSGNKIIQPRKLHMTHFGMCCPNETPEGQQIGIIKNLSMLCKISTHQSDFLIKSILQLLKKKQSLDDLVTSYSFDDLFIPADIISTDDIQKCTKVIVNGDIFGYVCNNITNKLYETLIVLKRHSRINIETSIAWFIEWNEIHIHTDGGRYIRPLYIVDNESYSILANNKSENDINWEKLTVVLRKVDKPTKHNGICIEYLDTNETENSMIAINDEDLNMNRDLKQKKAEYKKFTHCEIDPNMILSVVAQMIPYSDCNQSPRNIYQSSMGKQAIGTFCTNYNYRFDTMGSILIYGERPLNMTRTTPYTRLDKLPHGTNAMLLLAVYDGFNEEDATIFNEDSIKRGFFNTLYFRSYNDIETKTKSSSSNDTFVNPSTLENVVDKRKADYSCIEDSGVPIRGKEVKQSTVIIGKVVQIKDSDNVSFKMKDVSTVVRNHEEGVVDAVIPCEDDDRFNSVSNEDSDGNKFISTRVVQLRKPEIGDKFASRHSQKGVIGLLVKSVDMHFTNTGLVPDIIMNPHGIPSRMTQGKILETLGGKVAVCQAQVQDATPFMKRDNKKAFEDILEQYGYDKYGNEVMYNGKTGEMYNTTFYYGPTYYQRLKHMVADKIHSRDTGPVQMLTRQPADGRSRDGGHRIGEMERDVLISHGIACTLKESFMEKSDIFTRYVDRESGNLIIANESMNIYKLNNSDRIMRNQVSQIQYPYALDLGIKELNAIGIGIKLNTK